MSQQPSELDRIVGHNIRTRRDELGLYQAELGDKLPRTRTGHAVTQQQVADWERGRNPPKKATMLRIATILEKPLWWFYQEHP